MLRVMQKRLKVTCPIWTKDFLKINQFIDILANVIENIDKLALHKEPFRLKDKISTLTFKFCNLLKNNGL